MIDLSGKTILVTGGSRGIGAAMVESLTGAGAHVLLHYGHSKAKAEAVANSPDEQPALKLLNEQGDVRTGPIAREDIGIYTDGVTTYKVQRARSGSHTFALRLVGSEFVFRNGDTKQLTRGAYRKLTRDEAAAYGHQFGRCIVCAADLTDPASVERGMGPVCAQKF